MTDKAPDRQELLQRISIDPEVCGGRPCVEGTRIYIAILLEGLTEGLTPQDLLVHYPQLTLADIQAALAYAAELAQEDTWKAAV